jgi:hypothetical protein
MKRIALLCAALALLGASDPQNDGKYFVGKWTCGGVPWSFAPLLAGSSWIEISYGRAGNPDGTAVMGYVTGLGTWVYRDFHADGSYADLTSPGLVDGRWVWSGPYYRAAGGPALNGRITYVEVDAAHYDRIFESLESGVYVKHGNDSCMKSP